ncbi:hypothetical protein SAMN04488103_1066 [Gemmobacter aquatilis]|uniref:Uncharacterized protein n=1 Tax=Gemmobacter aquatilis TaxID=933059 RepID=A0A1H8HP65_9RHOB|nr:hypothetical protein [Gemmobacter aquatilis]SEN57991.1 hypothetical protein SAMN04488103_1066 [Gemmobacter aquatilis]
MTAKIDRRFAKRFPERQWWLRPATAEERLVQFRGRSVEGWHPCLVVGRNGDKFMSMPFYASSREVTDIDDDDAAATAASVGSALLDGAMPYVEIRR